MNGNERGVKGVEFIAVFGTSMSQGFFGRWRSGNHKRKEYTRTKAQAWSFQGKADIVVSCG